MHDFNYYLNQFNEFGVVEELFYPLIKVSGIPNAKSSEVVVFEDGQFGQLLYMDQFLAEVLLFSGRPVNIGMKVARTGHRFYINAGEYLCGLVVDSLGNKLFLSNDGGEGSSGVVGDQPTQERFLDTPQQSILNRRQITEPLLTGVSKVDLLLPLGKGQRQLVVGQRKTGKTSFLLSVIKNQIKSGALVVYAAIGKQMSDVELVRQWFVKEQLMDRVVMVVAGTQEVQSMIYTCPFTAMTIAEYFKDTGRDVVVVLDDLSTHARFYREISLLSRRFPGRESYPGDMFYIHARLLERAGCFAPLNNSKNKPVSISCLCVAETKENDLTDYIVSNLIGITDGHLLFDNNEFLAGKLPAIKTNLSVTRVGKQTQKVLSQDVNRKLMVFMNDYEKSQKFVHFGTELTAEIQRRMMKGQMLDVFFTQNVEKSIPFNLQIFIVGLIWELDLWKSISEIGSDLTGDSADLKQIIKNVTLVRDKFVQVYIDNPSFKNWLDEVTEGVYSLDDLVKKLKDDTYMVMVKQFVRL